MGAARPRFHGAPEGSPTSHRMFESAAPLRPAPHLMAARFRPALLALLVLVAAPLAAAQDAPVRRCAVEDPAPAERAWARQVVERYRALGTARPALGEGPVVVPLAVHVLTAGGAGATDAQVEAQVAVLDAAFRGMGYRVALAALDRTENAAWARGLRLDSPEEAAMKRALTLDPTVFLNVYVADLFDDYLGWATTPDDRRAGTPLDGVVLATGTLPGGADAPFNEGDTGVHEVGHWVGLDHTFAGGCTGAGDGVADTPAERSPASGCPTARDSCPLDPGLDPVQNYMDYSDDACMVSFTAGQRERARALTAERRPAVAAGGRVLVTAAPRAFDGAFVGFARTAPLRVTNTTDEAVTVTAVRASDPAFASGGAGTVVAPGSVAVLDLAFTAAAPGTTTAAVTVQTDAGSAEVVVSGSATAPPLARLPADAPRAVVLEGATVALEVPVANAGGADLSFSVGATPPWVVAVDPEAGVLAPGETAALTVTVSAEDLAVAAGQRRREVGGAVSLTTNDPYQPTLDVPLVAVVSERPAAFALGAPFPNPGRGRITVPVELPDDAAVTVEVFDALGRRVAVLARVEALGAGFQDVVWDAGAAPPGLYLVQARGPGGAAVARVVVAR